MIGAHTRRPTQDNERKTLAGLSAGAFIGAKFTRLVPLPILRRIMIAIPLSGGLLLLLRG